MDRKWIKYVLVFIGFSCLFILLKCKTSETQNLAPTEEVQITDDLPSSFLDFYERFHNEEDYQMEHIVFPLKGHEQDTATMGLVQTIWNKENWVRHQPFNSYGGTFTREYSNMNGIILEKISDSSNTFTMQRRYSQIAGEWNLIYYSTFQMKPE